MDPEILNISFILNLKRKNMSKIKTLAVILSLSSINQSYSQNNYVPTTEIPAPPEGFNLIWADEFNEDGKPNDVYWSYENGFTRNEELMVSEG